MVYLKQDTGTRTLKLFFVPSPKRDPEQLVFLLCVFPGLVIYVNGELLGNAQWDWARDQPGAGRMVIGKRFANDDERDISTIEVDELFLLNDALTSEEVKQLYRFYL